MYTCSFHYIFRCTSLPVFFFFNDTATTEIYTLSLHDALPILVDPVGLVAHVDRAAGGSVAERRIGRERPDGRHDRSEEHTLNSSHLGISYAVFCLKKKKKKKNYKSTE